MNSTLFHDRPKELSGLAFKEYSAKKSIVAHLSNHREATVSELAGLLNTSFPKTSELLNTLQQEGIVLESGRRSEGLGRRATIFRLDPTSCYFLGVEIKKYRVNMALMSFDKAIVKSSMNIPFPFVDNDKSMQELLASIEQFLQASAINRSKILGVGLSIPGRVNVQSGETLTNFHFANVPFNIQDILQKNLGLPVYIDNDSRTIAYGEYFFSPSPMPKTTLILNIDYGSALGIFIDGKPLYGASGYAGELGHIPVFDNEKLCFCGKKGCLETEASGAALIRHIEEQISLGHVSSLQEVLQQKERLELEDIIDAVHKGDNVALEGISRIAFKLGKGLAVAINIFNPNLIVLGGILAAAGTPLLLPVQSGIYQFSLSLVSNDTRVILSEQKEMVGIKGCCLLVRDKILGFV